MTSRRVLLAAFLIGSRESERLITVDAYLVAGLLRWA